MQKLYSVTELAKDLGVTPRTLRFYEDKGLIAPQRAGSTRVYTHHDRGRIMLILRGKRLGFTLREVRDWLDLYEVDSDQATQMNRLKDKLCQHIDFLERQRDDVNATLRELRSILNQVVHFEPGGRSGAAASPEA